MPEIRNVKGSQLPYFLLEQLRATPQHTFTITPEVEIEYDDEGKPFPPEESFKPEFVAEVERRCRDSRAGKNITVCETEEEQTVFFNKVWNE